MSISKDITFTDIILSNVDVMMEFNNRLQKIKLFLKNEPAFIHAVDGIEFDEMGFKLSKIEDDFKEREQDFLNTNKFMYDTITLLYLRFVEIEAYVQVMEEDGY